MEDGQPIEHNMISRAIENAQSRVEGHNFEIRKTLIEYDDVMNQQREVIYRQRREALDGKSLKATIEDMIRTKAEEIADTFAEDRLPAEEWDLKGLKAAAYKQFNFRLNMDDPESLEGMDGNGLAELINEAAVKIYDQRESVVGADEFRHLERVVMLQTVDNLWKDHLLSMDHLKEGIGLRGYAQQNPLIVYKKEGYDMFQDMINRVQEETIGILYRIQIAEPEKIEEIRQPDEQQMFFSGGDEPEKKKPVKRTAKKIGRNAPCPCGSGKKYKKCCGK
jgi:preprotein translocase subunit SecA